MSDLRDRVQSRLDELRGLTEGQILPQISVIDADGRREADLIVAAVNLLPGVIAWAQYVHDTHDPTATTEIVTWACARGDCDHQDECPIVSMTPCRACECEQADDNEDHGYSKDWPCPNYLAMSAGIGVTP